MGYTFLYPNKKQKTGNMKATLEFNLPEDQEEYNRANKARDLCSLLWNLEEMFRSSLRESENKDDIDETDIIKYQTMEKVWDEYIKLKEENGINIDELYT